MRQALLKRIYDFCWHVSAQTVKIDEQYEGGNGFRRMEISLYLQKEKKMLWLSSGHGLTSLIKSIISRKNKKFLSFSSSQKCSQSCAVI